MRVRLLTRWGSRMQGDVVSVSDERAFYLESEGIAKVLEPEPSPEKVDESEPEAEPEPSPEKRKK